MKNTKWPGAVNDTTLKAEAWAQSTPQIPTYACNLDATEETYNKDPTLSIHP